MVTSFGISRVGKIILLICLFACTNLLSAKTIGSIVDDDIYTTSSAEKPYYGSLNILIYSETKNNGGYLFFGQDFEFWIGDNKVASVEQSFADMSMQQGNFNYLSLPLPNGKYQVSLFRRSIWGATKFSDFEVIIRSGKTLSIFVDVGDKSDSGITASPKGIKSTHGNFKLVPKYNIFFEAYDLIQKNEAGKAIEFAQFELQTKKGIEEKKQRQIAGDLKLKEEREKTAQELEALEKERTAALLLQEEKKKKAEEESVAKEDDMTCKSFGAKPGTQPYVLCRAKVAAGRQEVIDRQRANIALEKKVDALRNKVIEQDNQRVNELDAIERRRAQESDAMQQRYMAEQAQREKAERSERSMRYFEAAARMLQPTGPLPSQAPSQGVGGNLCYFQREWTSSMNRNCVYSCMGSEATNTVAASQSCPSTIRR
jgi:hypothetical protein